MKNIELADMKLLKIAEDFLQDDLKKKVFDNFSKTLVKRDVLMHSQVWNDVYDFAHEVWKDVELPEKLETALTEYVEVFYLHKKEETVWICVYKDTIRKHNDNDNLAHIRVLKSFAEQYHKQQTDSEWKTFEEFLNNYTADETDDFYVYAKKHNAILEMDVAEEITVKKRNYMLISVWLRRMQYSYFDTLEDAQKEMWNEVFRCSNDLSAAIEDGTAEVNEMDAWITDGNNHNDYDWWIIDQRRSVYELLCETGRDYDTEDTVVDTSVTVCYIEETAGNDNYDKFCIGLMKKAKVQSCDGDNVVVDWSGLIWGNDALFKQFMKKHWKTQYTDPDEFLYQWIKELHYMMAGLVDDDTYKELVKLVDKLK